VFLQDSFSSIVELKEEKNYLIFVFPFKRFFTVSDNFTEKSKKRNMFANNVTLDKD
jgi:hypothetical protein